MSTPPERDAGDIVADWMENVIPITRAARSHTASTPPKLDGNYQRQAWAYIEGIARNQAELTKGSRNNKQNESGYKAFRVAIGADIPLADVENIIYDANVTNGQVADDGEKAVRDTIASSRASAERDGPEYLPEQEQRIQPATVFDPRGDDAAPQPEKKKLPWNQYIIDAEEDFWDRPSLAAIKEASMARMASPWAVLGLCAARALTTVRPGTVLPPVIGGPGSLNWFCALVATSGGGKGIATNVARELIPVTIRERNMGSGEGIIGAFYKPPSGNEPGEDHEAVLFSADEVDTIAAMNQRSGSTSMAILRSAFSGETLGFSYVTKGRDVHLERQTYRLTFVVAVQPARAGTLMADSHGGTPQRFMWFPSTDPRIADNEDEDNFDYHVAPLNIPNPGAWQYPRTLTIPRAVRREIRRQHAKRARGDGDALDGHSMFCREKFAFALALLDGRTEMTDEDWRLSGIASEISSRTRDWVNSQLKHTADEEAVERGRQQGISRAEADVEQANRNSERLNRVGRWILEKLEHGPVTQRDMQRAIASRDRGWLSLALGALEKEGHIVSDDVTPDGARGRKQTTWRMAP